MASAGSVLASDLAGELGLSVAELLARADALIGQVVDLEGIEAARGLSTETEQRESYAVVRITPALAGRLRAQMGER